MAKATITIEELDLGTPNENGADGEGFILDYEVPTMREVCGRCDGNGSITNPSIGAITGEEWANEWDEDERDMYMKGVYDVQCPDCKGRNVVDVPNPDAIQNPIVKQAVLDHLDAEASYASECAHERKMGY